MANIFLIFICFFLASTEAISLPSHNCSEYFTYGLDANGSYIGILTADKAGVQELNFTAIFLAGSKRQVSGCKLYPSENDAIRNIESGYRGQAFVQFNNSTVLPTLYMFIFNGNVLCKSKNEHIRQPSIASLTECLKFTSRTIRKSKSPRPIMHPIFPQIEPKISV